MATTLRPSDGDVLDTLCYWHYGHLTGTVEAVLDANPRLAELPQPYPAGLEIVFPDLPPPATQAVRLWD